MHKAERVFLLLKSYRLLCRESALDATSSLRIWNYSHEELSRTQPAALLEGEAACLGPKALLRGGTSKQPWRLRP